jgi:UDP-N-acetyl-D-mannosaminuronic acid dehydrogenase
MDNIKKFSICVVGLGFVGLPTALLLASKQFEVFGYDKDTNLIDELRLGHISVSEIGLKSLLKKTLTSRKFKPCNKIQKADIYFICVPTPITEKSNQADLTAVLSVVKEIKRIIKPGDLIVLESTSPVGATEDIYNTLLDHVTKKYDDKQSQTNKFGSVFVAYCPERILPGKALYELSNLDRVIGGVNEQSSRFAMSLFRELTVGRCIQTDSKTAEFVKLAENSFRDVNIAFANELRDMCVAKSVEFTDVQKLANKHPRVQILQAGIGVGGHCIPVDPWFLLSSSRSEEAVASVIRSARDINDRQPELVATEIKEFCKKNKINDIMILGLTYKADVNDFRGSPASKIVQFLSKSGELAISVCDPFLKSDHTIISFGEVKVEDIDSISEKELYVFLVAHKRFIEVYSDVSRNGHEVLNFCNL